MMKNISFKYIFLLIVVLGIAGLNADGAVSKLPPTLHLKVSLNGIEITGLQAISSKFHNLNAANHQAVLAEVAKQTIHLKRGSANQLRVSIVSDNGTLKDVTLDPGLSVDATLGQLSFANGILTASPTKSMSALDTKTLSSGPLVLSIAYMQNEAKQVYGFDQFYIELTD